MTDMRDTIAQAMKQALKDKNQPALGTIRLIAAALKDRDIAARGQDKADGITDDEILAMLQTMIKQRHDSVSLYEKGGRDDLVAIEKAEISIIQQFLPEPLSEAECDAALKMAIAATKAASVKDMGKVMGIATKNMLGKADGKIISTVVRKLLS